MRACRRPQLHVPCARLFFHEAVVLGRPIAKLTFGHSSAELSHGQGDGMH